MWATLMVAAAVAGCGGAVRASHCHLPASPAANLSLHCDSPGPINTYLATANLTLVRSLTLRCPSPSRVHFSRLNITSLDLAHTGLLYFNSSLPPLKNLNLSHNRLKTFPLNSTQSSDLSNSVDHLSTVNPSVELNLRKNFLEKVDNFRGDMERMDLGGNRIREVFLGECKNLRELDLSRNKLRELREGAFGKAGRLEVLNLSENALETVEKGVLVSSLVTVDLSRNRLRSLGEGCFDGLNHLQRLVLAGNSVTRLSARQMQELPGLVWLTVSGNRLSGLRLVLARLERFEARDNGLTAVPASLTGGVRELDLASNAIGEVRCGDLDTYPVLRSLSLANNNLSQVEDDALGRLELLARLDLNHNSLTSVPHTLPGNLTELLLHHNWIRAVSVGDLAGLGRLRTLDLSHNLISNVSDAFSQLESLRVLNLSSNPVVFLGVGSVGGLSRLVQLDLGRLRSAAPSSLAFPLPTTTALHDLVLAGSPAVAQRLLDDPAALNALRQLTFLDLSHCNLTSVPDLPSLLPHTTINLRGNELNCSLPWIHHLTSSCNFSEETLEPTEYEILTNEIYDNASAVVFAFSSEVPASHPGLFVLLLVPLALVSAVLVINYSRLRTPHIQFDPEIEIPEFSELW